MLRAVQEACLRKRKGEEMRIEIKQLGLPKIVRVKILKREK